MKSKGIAYLLWLFGGVLGAHKFYLERIGVGIFYALSAGGFGIGCLIDLFTLGRQVDEYNILHGYQNIGGRQNVAQNVVVNITPSMLQGAQGSVSSVQISAEKQILMLTEQSPVLSLRQIIAQTNLESEEAESTVKKLVEKGMAAERVDSSGKVTYDFS
ncbi:hypothetical protein FACS1894164_10930 [Spirochaetia bacterium]|nr:hypothetical protein FACS1894164_10930 [Spirochaetia bacterium]